MGGGVVDVRLPLHNEARSQGLMGGNAGGQPAQSLAAERGRHQGAQLGQQPLVLAVGAARDRGRRRARHGP